MTESYTLNGSTDSRSVHTSSSEERNCILCRANYDENVRNGKPVSLGTLLSLMNRGESSRMQPYKYSGIVGIANLYDARTPSTDLYRSDSGSETKSLSTASLTSTVLDTYEYEPKLKVVASNAETKTYAESSLSSAKKYTRNLPVVDRNGEKVHGSFTNGLRRTSAEPKPVTNDIDSQNLAKAVSSYGSARNWLPPPVTTASGEYCSGTCSMAHKKELKVLEGQIADVHRQRESALREVGELKVQLKMVEETRDNIRRDLIEANRKIREGTRNFAPFPLRANS